MKKLIFAFLVLALALASAKTYTVTLLQPATVAGTELQPGDYKVSVMDDGKVVLKSGKHSIESAAKVEQADKKFDSTTVRLQTSDSGKPKIEEIRLGGTKTRLVFN